jgi:hypothetical protein
MQVGVFQISVFAPKNTGAAAGLNTADDLIELFKRGTTLAYGSVVNIRLSASYRKPAIEEGVWYHIPVTVTYYCYLSN